MLRLNKFLV